MRGITTRAFLSAVLACLSVAYFAQPSSAGVITLEPKGSLTDLLGAGYAADGDLMITNMDMGNLKADTYSRAYVNSVGDTWAYLYQVLNTGTGGNSPVEMFTLWPFTGADGNTQMGYFTDTVPSEFVGTPWQEPQSQGYVKPLTSGPQISFYYTELADKGIEVGDHSSVMYVKSELSPDEIMGNVIDGSVGSGLVVGPVPEPATMGLLALGAIALVARRRRR